MRASRRRRHLLNTVRTSVALRPRVAIPFAAGLVGLQAVEVWMSVRRGLFQNTPHYDITVGAIVRVPASAETARRCCLTPIPPHAAVRAVAAGVWRGVRRVWFQGFLAAGRPARHVRRAPRQRRRAGAKASQ